MEIETTPESRAVSPALALTEVRASSVFVAGLSGGGNFDVTE